MKKLNLVRYRVPKIFPPKKTASKLVYEELNKILHIKVESKDYGRRFLGGHIFCPKNQIFKQKIVLKKFV